MFNDISAKYHTRNQVICYEGIERHQVGSQRSLGELEDSFKRTWVGSAEKLRNLLEITQPVRGKLGHKLEND